MQDSGAILCQISLLKDMLDQVILLLLLLPFLLIPNKKKKVSQQPEISANGDRDPNQVNEEIEANIQITREIESEILKCSESEEALAARESDLTKTLYVSQFEINTLLVLTRKIFFLSFFFFPKIF